MAHSWRQRQASKQVLVYDASDFTSAPTRLTDATTYVPSIAYNHDSTQLAAGEGRPGIPVNVKIYDGNNPVSGSGNFNPLETGESGGLYSLAYNPAGTQLAMGWGSEVRVYDAINSSSPNLFRLLRNLSGSVRSVIYNHNGTQLATGDARGTVRIYDGMNPTSDTFQELTDSTKQIYNI